MKEESAHDLPSVILAMVHGTCVFVKGFASAISHIDPGIVELILGQDPDMFKRDVLSRAP